jgi:glutamate 5-kinase
METKLIAAEIASAGGVSTIICKSSNPANVLDIIGHISANKSAASLAQPVPTAVSTPSSVMNSDSEDSSNSNSSSVTSIASTVTAAPVGSTSTSSHSNHSEARPLYTLFKPSTHPLRDVKSWTTYALAPSGSVIIDVGAHAVLSRRESGGRLLAVGVVGVAGTFAPGQAVRILVRRHLERKDHHQLVFGHQQKGSMGGAAALPAFKEVADSQGASPATPSTPNLSPKSTIGSISTMELLSRSASHGSLDAEAADVEATPMVSKLTLEPDAHEHNEGLEGQTPSRKATGDSSGSGKKAHVHADVKPEGEWIDVEVGRGLANYNSADITKVMGMKR